MTGEATDLVILLKGVATIDHARGCQGREYTCSCGWDEEREQYAAQAATLIEAQAAEIEELKARLDRYENTGMTDASDEDAGRMIKAFFAAVEEWSSKEWKGEAARRLGLMSMGLMQAIVAAWESNAETFTYTAERVTHKGHDLGDWEVIVRRTFLASRTERADADPS